MEVNAGRVGFQPEEMYKPILKPIRTISLATPGGLVAKILFVLNPSTRPQVRSKILL
jgi:hypothetical protein